MYNLNHYTGPFTLSDYIIVSYILHLQTDNIISYGFSTQTYFEELKRRIIHYIYPDIYHLVYFSFVLNFQVSFWSHFHFVCKTFLPT